MIRYRLSRTTWGSSFETIITLCSLAGHRRRRIEVSNDHDGEGKGDNVEHAAEKAWEDAKGKGKTPGLYEIKKIEVVTENPITEYRVKIKKV